MKTSKNLRQREVRERTRRFFSKNAEVHLDPRFASPNDSPHNPESRKNRSGSVKNRKNRKNMQKITIFFRFSKKYTFGVTLGEVWGVPSRYPAPPF